MTDRAPIRRADLISRRAAAEMLGVHANTLDRWMHEAGAKKYRVRGDNRIFYLRSEVETCSDPIVEVA